MPSRQITQRLEKFLKQGAAREVCSICREPFGHNVRTYSGVAAGGALACVGECCVRRLEAIYFVGVFLHDKHGVYAGVGGKAPGSGKSYSVEQIAAAVARTQKNIQILDEEFGDLDAVLKRGGVPNARFTGLDDPPWKVADAEWFEQHPERSHHARLPMAGEAEAFGLDRREPPPQDHGLCMLVRQVEPGRRIRTAIFMPEPTLPVPDLEPLAHALFDIAARDAGTGRPVRKAEVMALCERYMNAGGIADG
jgi:hypothetical protein